MASTNQTGTQSAADFTAQNLFSVLKLSAALHQRLRSLEEKAGEVLAAELQRAKGFRQRWDRNAFYQNVGVSLAQAGRLAEALQIEARVQIPDRYESSRDYEQALLAKTSILGWTAAKSLANQSQARGRELLSEALAYANNLPTPESSATYTTGHGLWSLVQALKACKQNHEAQRFCSLVINDHLAAFAGAELQAGTLIEAIAAQAQLGCADEALASTANAARLRCLSSGALVTVYGHIAEAAFLKEKPPFAQAALQRALRIIEAQDPVCRGDTCVSLAQRMLRAGQPQALAAIYKLAQSAESSDSRREIAINLACALAGSGRAGEITEIVELPLLQLPHAELLFRVGGTLLEKGALAQGRAFVLGGCGKLDEHGAGAGVPDMQAWAERQIERIALSEQALAKDLDFLLQLAEQRMPSPQKQLGLRSRMAQWASRHNQPEQSQALLRDCGAIFESIADPGSPRINPEEHAAASLNYVIALGLAGRLEQAGNVAARTLTMAGRIACYDQVRAFGILERVLEACGSAGCETMLTETAAAAERLMQEMPAADRELAARSLCHSMSAAAVKLFERANGLAYGMTS